MSIKQAGPIQLQDRAAETIQRNFRGFKDRLKVRERAAFNISQLIEYAEEQDHLNLNKFFSRWISLIKSKSEQDVSHYISSSIQSDLVASEKDIQIEPDYAGIHLNESFSQEEFERLIDSYKSGQTLHTVYALRILNKAIDYLKTLPNINELKSEYVNDEMYKVTVVGDLHGQFHDLATIFELNGLPSDSNRYLFNGDFVDRGPHQCEVYLTLLYALVLYKGAVCLNRGNHEDYGCSVRFGFKEEIMNKYCLYSNLMTKKFALSFSFLPVASIIYQQAQNQTTNKILVVHGGVSIDFDLESLKSLNRSSFPNIDGTDHSVKIKDKELKDKQLLQDILWSDPQSGTGCVFNKQRHIAKQFGPDITQKVLAKHGFSLLIRSHECKNEGYEFHHNNKCITIFSASNYCGGINKGSICVIRPAQKLEIRQFVAQPGLENDRQRVLLFEEKAIRGLKRLLYTNRAAVRDEFKKMDPKNTGFLSLSDWSTALSKAVGGIEKIPWLKYRDKLVEYNEKKNMVRYETVFDNCDVVYTFTTEHQDINDALARYKETLVSIFNLIDDNNSGAINLQEFANACKIIFLDQNEPISDEAIKSMIEAMDTNKDGKIDLAEFTQAFVVYT